MKSKLASVLKDILIPAQGYYTIAEIGFDNASTDIIYKAESETKAAFSKGRIIKAGPNWFSEYGIEVPQQFKEGDIVIFSYSGFEKIVDKGQTIFLIRSQAIQAKYNESNK